MSQERFTVLSNYLFHIRKLCLDRYANGELRYRSLHRGILSAGISTGIKRHKSADIEKIQKTIHNCWLTELNLHQEFYYDIDAIDITYFLGWKTVQAYYVCFLSLRALYEIYLGQSRFSHNDLLNRFSQDNEVFGFLAPFDIHYGKNGFNNLTSAVTKINPLSKYYKSEDYIALWCRTTYEEHQRDRWNKSPHPRKKWGKICNVDCKDVSILDCLYRLRKKHNYDSIDHLLSGISENQGRDVDMSLSVITFSFLSMAEVILWQLLSETERKNIANEYIKKMGGDISRQKLLKIRLEQFI